MNKKKIVCVGGMAIILVIVIIFYLVRVLSNNTQNFIESTVAEQTSTNEILEENTIVENVIAEPNISNSIQQENGTDVAQITETETVQAIDIKKNDAKVKKQQTTQVETQTQTQVQPQEVYVQPQTQTSQVESCTEKQVETVTQVQFTVPKEEIPNSNNNSVVSEEKPKDTQENTYVYNAQMTQQLVDIINNNPSQFMQQYGFTVSTDSSITSLTNQFTFAENRVIEKIQNKFGTIRVYAQDYYLNGEYLFTECYII